MSTLKWVLLIVSVVVLWQRSVAKTCHDKVSDCHRATDYCKRGGVGSTVRNNCMLTCGLCTPSTAPVSAHHSPRKSSNRHPKQSSGKHRHGRPTHHTGSRRTPHQRRPIPRKPRPQPQKRDPIKRNPIGPNQIHVRPQPYQQRPTHPPHTTHQHHTPRTTVQQRLPNIVATTASTAATTKNTPAPQPVATPKPPEPKNPIFKESLDENTLPCDNFYKFTCGTYIQSRPNNEDHWVANDIQQQLIRQRQIEVIMDNTPSGSIAVNNMRKYRDLCMDTTPVEALKTRDLGIKILAYGQCPMYNPAWTQLINGKSFTETFTSMAQYASRHFLFDMSVRRHDDGQYMMLMSPEPLIMEEPEKYFQPEHQADVAALAQFLKEVLTIVGQDNGWIMSDMDGDVREIIEYDKRRAQDYANNNYTLHRRSRSKQMDKIQFSELNTLFGVIEWDKYIRNDPLLSDAMKTQILTPGYEILLYNKKLTKELETGILYTGYDKVANYYVARLILNQIPYLDHRFQDALLRYKAKIDGRAGRATKQEECVDSTIELFPLVADYLYMQSHFDPLNETDFTQTIQSHIKDGVQQLIEKQQWLDQPTRTYALQKLLSAQVNMGGVAEAKLIQYLNTLYAPYTTTPGVSFQQTYINLRKIMKQQALVNTPQNGPMYELRSAEIEDLYYRYSENTAYVPASLVNPTFYNKTLLIAYNYGSIGTMISRQFMRAFDITGLQYDRFGLKTNTLSPAMQTEFDRRTKLLEAQYWALAEPQTNLHINGTRTLDENIIDNAAIKASFLAYKEDLKKQGISSENGHISGYGKYTPEQVFYISYGMSMCSAVTADFHEHLIEDGETSPSVYRVNTVLQNDANFAQVFQCQPGTTMNPAVRVEVW